MDRDTNETMKENGLEVVVVEEAVVVLVNGIIVIEVVVRIEIIDDDRIGAMSLNRSLNDW